MIWIVRDPKDPLPRSHLPITVYNLDGTTFIIPPATAAPEVVQAPVVLTPPVGPPPQQKPAPLVLPGTTQLPAVIQLPAATPSKNIVNIFKLNQPRILWLNNEFTGDAVGQ